MEIVSVFNLKCQKDQIPGGISDGNPDSKYDEKQIEKGVKIELEHTDDIDLAREIAKDHLEEFPDYYDNLEEMETKMKKDKKQTKAFNLKNKKAQLVQPPEIMEFINKEKRNKEIENSKTMDKKDRTEINKNLRDLIIPENKQRYFEQIPLKDIFDILKNNSLIALQEDNTPWSGFLIGRESNTTFPIAYEVSKDAEGFYYPVENAVLYLYWYKMEESGRYEVNAYIT